MDLKKQYVHTRNWVKATSKAAVFETKRSALLLAFGFVCTIADAQNYGVGQAAISDAAQGIAKYQDSVQKLVYAIAAVVGIVGAFSVYFKMQNGDQDVKNILVLQNWLERIRKEVTNKVLNIKRISDFLIFPILAQPTLKKI